MLDIGWTELVVIAIVLIIVVGPKDLPPMLRAFGRMATKLRGMAGDFRQQFDEALKEADLDDVRKTIGDAQKLNPVNSIREAMNPLRALGNEIKSDIQKSVSDTPKPQVAASDTSATAEALGTAESKPVDAKPTDVVAAAAVASAKKQLDASKGTHADAIAEAAAKPKAKRTPKAAIAQPVDKTPATAATVKPARTKVTSAVASQISKPVVIAKTTTKTPARQAVVEKTVPAVKIAKTKTAAKTGKTTKKGDA